MSKLCLEMSWWGSHTLSLSLSLSLSLFLFSSLLQEIHLYVSTPQNHITIPRVRASRLVLQKMLGLCSESRIKAPLPWPTSAGPGGVPVPTMASEIGEHHPHNMWFMNVDDTYAIEHGT